MRHEFPHKGKQINNEQRVDFIKYYFPFLLTFKNSAAPIGTSINYMKQFII